MAKAPPFERVAIIGIGLIGSSLCHAIRRADLAKHIAAYDLDADVRETAVTLGLTDSVHTRAEEAVADADLIVLCAPVGTFAQIAESIAPHLMSGAILTDVGSVKGAVVRDIAPHIPKGVHFIPGHPIAGTEHSGPEAGFAELFDDRWTILTPSKAEEPNAPSAAAIERLTQFWESCGANVDRMEVEHHDLVLAITSHLPHLIAYNIVGTAADLEADTKAEVIKYSASGFRDFTRIAASDPTMWRDIFLNNREAVLEMLGRFNEDLVALQRAIRRGDADMLFDRFTRTREIRRQIIDAGQETTEPDFGRPHGKHDD